MTSQFVQGILPYLRFDDDFTALVTKALAQGSQEDSSSTQKQAQRIEHALEQLRKQHLWGDLPHEAYVVERDNLRRQLQALKSSVPVARIPNLQRAAELLNDLPALWQHPGVEDQQRQELLKETFEEVRIMGKQLVSIRPRPQYLPHFAYLTLAQRYCLNGTRGRTSWAIPAIRRPTRLRAPI